MIFTIKFLNLKLTQENFELIHKQIIEICSDCIVHDCNTAEGFTIQLKPIDYQVKGRLELKSNYDNTNTLIIGIEKDFLTTWSMDTMQKLVQDLQTFDQSLK